MNDVAAHFETGFKDWEAKLQADEWYFCTLREALVGTLAPCDAFANMSRVVELVLRQQNEFLCAEATELLLALASRADTTQLHPDVERDWERLTAHLMSFGGYVQNQARKLSSWYRRAEAVAPSV